MKRSECKRGFAFEAVASTSLCVSLGLQVKWLTRSHAPVVKLSTWGPRLKEGYEIMALIRKMPPGGGVC